MQGSLFKVVFILLVLGIVNTLMHGQGTRVGFYSSTCSQAESIVKSTVTSHVNSDSFSSWFT
jgi:peroxidase